MTPPGKDLPDISDAMLLRGLTEDSEDLCTVISTTSLTDRTQTDLGTCWHMNKLHPSPQPSIGAQMQTFTEEFFDKKQCIDPVPDPTFPL